MAAAHPFLDLERAGADRRIVDRVGDDVAVRINVFWNNQARFAGEHGFEEELRNRSLELQHHRERIDGLSGLQRVKRHAGRDRLPVFHRSEDDVVSGERLAIVPGDVVAKFDGVAVEVGSRLDVDGEHRLEGEIDREPEQALEDFGRGEVGARPAACGHEQGLRFEAAPRGDQRAAAFWRGCSGG